MNVLLPVVQGSSTALSFANIRNGALAGITAVSRPSSIPAYCHWCPVNATGAWNAFANIAANAETASAYILSAHISTAFGMHVGAAAVSNAAGAVAIAAGPGAAAVGNGAAAWGNAGSATAAAYHAALANPEARLFAVVLGSARHALSASYAPQAGEFKPNEVSLAILAMDHTPVVAPAVGMGTVVSTFRSGHTAAANDLLPYEVAAAATGPLTAAEADLSALVQRMAVAAPPLAGMHLVVDTHHYLTGRSKRNEGVERQVMAEATDAARASWAASTLTIRDLLWHKSIHPLSTTFLISLATDTEVPQRLGRANLGSAAIALPVREGPLQTGDAYLAIFRAVSTVALGHGVTINAAALTVAMASTRAFVRPEAPNSAAINAQAAANLAPADALVVSLQSAIDRVLKPAIANAATGAAFCYGYFKALAKDQNITQASPEGTLLGSFALQNAAKQVPGEAARGGVVFERGNKILEAQAKQGNIIPITLNM